MPTHRLMCSSAPLSKTRLNGLSYGIKIWRDLSYILSQSTHLTDRQTEFSLLDRVCIPCSVVKPIKWKKLPKFTKVKVQETNLPCPNSRQLGQNRAKPVHCKHTHLYTVIHPKKQKQAIVKSNAENSWPLSKPCIWQKWPSNTDLNLI